MEDQEVNKAEEMFKKFWQGESVADLIKGATDVELKDFVGKVVEDGNKELIKSLCMELLTKGHSAE